MTIQMRFICVLIKSDFWLIVFTSIYIFLINKIIVIWNSIAWIIVDFGDMLFLAKALVNSEWPRDGHEKKN